MGSGAEPRLIMMRTATLVLLLAAVVILEGQPSVDPNLHRQLEQLFPAATDFSPKEGAPPHFKAYVSAAGSGQRTLAGYAFWTTELEPLERGYDGPIQILVGVDLNGILTGIVVVRHHEPYGYFSVDTRSSRRSSCARTSATVSGWVGTSTPSRPPR